MLLTLSQCIWLSYEWWVILDITVTLTGDYKVNAGLIGFVNQDLNLGAIIGMFCFSISLFEAVRPFRGSLKIQSRSRSESRAGLAWQDL